MKHPHLISVVVTLLHIVSPTLSFERSSNQKSPFMPGWRRSFGISKINLAKKVQDSIEPSDEGRRNLLLGSVRGALGSAIWGCSTQPAKASTVILEESEARRIDIFERNAPSVVFIDTFIEKQDVFSPNVMEVPLGSGSGFVWDKEGHIGR